MDTLLTEMRAMLEKPDLTPHARHLIESAIRTQSGESTLTDEIDRLNDPYSSPEYAAFVEKMAETCHATMKPCDSCLAGGICDGPDPEHDDLGEDRDPYGDEEHFTP